MNIMLLGKPKAENPKAFIMKALKHREISHFKFSRQNQPVHQRTASQNYSKTNLTIISMI